MAVQVRTALHSMCPLPIRRVMSSSLLEQPGHRGDNDAAPGDLSVNQILTVPMLWDRLNAMESPESRLRPSLVASSSCSLALARPSAAAAAAAAPHAQFSSTIHV